MMKRQAISCEWMAFLLLLGGGVSAQPQEQQQHPQHSQTITVIVDGSKNPELISTALAFRHFLLASSLRSDAPPDQIARNSAQLASISLSKEDRQVLLSALNDLRITLDGLDASSSRESDTALAQTRRAALESALNIAAEKLVTQSLSIPGRDQLTAYIETYVKKRIKIYEISAQ